MIRNWIAVLTQGTDASAGSTLIPFVIMLVVFAAVFYFMIYRPQANQEKKQKALLSSLAIGDSVLTTGGFYGVIIDMVEDQDIIIVERCHHILDIVTLLLVELHVLQHRAELLNPAAYIILTAFSYDSEL